MARCPVSQRRGRLDPAAAPDSPVPPARRAAAARSAVRRGFGVKGEAVTSHGSA